MRIDQRTFDLAFDVGSVHESRRGDCERIVQVAEQRLQIRLTLHQAYEIWDSHSSSMCAGWLILDEDDEIVEAVNSFVRRRLESLTE